MLTLPGSRISTPSASLEIPHVKWCFSIISSVTSTSMCLGNLARQGGDLEVSLERLELAAFLHADGVRPRSVIGTSMVSFLSIRSS